MIRPVTHQGTRHRTRHRIRHVRATARYRPDTFDRYL